MRALIIASYDGPRRNNKCSATEMLETWEHQLKTLTHHLDLVVVVANTPTDGFTATYKDKLDNFDPGIEHVVQYRENEGGSYGAWIKILRRLQWLDLYEWAFVFEDDTLPVMDRWDDALLVPMADDVGYVGCHLAGGGEDWHMSAATGVVRVSVFGDAVYAWERLHAYDPAAQIGFSQAVVRAGYRLVAVTDDYSNLYWAGFTREIGNADRPLLTAPVEYLRGKL